MNWKGLLYDWGGFNVELFQLIIRRTAGWLGPVAWLGGFFGHYSWSLVGLATLWFAKLRCSKMGLLAETEHVALQLRRFGHHRYVQTRRAS